MSNCEIIAAMIVMIGQLSFFNNNKVESRNRRAVNNHKNAWVFEISLVSWAILPKPHPLAKPIKWIRPCIKSSKEKIILSIG